VFRVALQESVFSEYITFNSLKTDGTTLYISVANSTATKIASVMVIEAETLFREMMTANARLLESLRYVYILFDDVYRGTGHLSYRQPLILR